MRWPTSRPAGTLTSPIRGMREARLLIVVAFSMRCLCSTFGAGLLRVTQAAAAELRVRCRPCRAA